MIDRFRSLGIRSVAVVLGAGAGAAMVAYGVRRWRGVPRRRDVIDELEERAVEALRDIEPIASRPIDVSALREGALELSGAVSTEDEAKRAVAVLQALPEVHTVVNRLTVGEREMRLAETQRRWRAGDPSLTETQWEGMRVGMGRRRQGRSTDPDRRDDHVRMLSREMEADSGDLDGSELTGEDLDRSPVRRRPPPS